MSPTSSMAPGCRSTRLLAECGQDKYQRACKAIRERLKAEKLPKGDDEPITPAEALTFPDAVAKVLGATPLDRPEDCEIGPDGCSAPVDAELTGPTFTPDGSTLFLSVQHPGICAKAGESTSHWPAAGPDPNATASATNLARSAVVAIRRLR